MMEGLVSCRYICKESEIRDKILISIHLQRYGLNANSRNVHVWTHTGIQTESLYISLHYTLLTTSDGHYVCWSTWGDCCILSTTVKDGILPSTTVQPCDVPGTITRTKTSSEGVD